MNDREAETRALADRFVNYADAVTAVAFVGASGLGAALGDPEVRESIARGAPYVLIGEVVMGLLCASIVLGLRRWELDLRSEWALEGKLLRYSRRLHWARLIVIAFSTIQGALLLWVAS